MRVLVVGPMRRRSVSCAAALLVGVLVATSRAGAACVGDCGGTGSVSIDELILGVNIALGLQPASACPAFQNAQGQVGIAQLIQGVNNSLSGCPDEPTATATLPLGTPTGTATAAQTATATGVASPTPTAAAATGTATALQTTTPSETSAPSATSTQTPASTATVTATGTESATATPTDTPTLSASPTSTQFPIGLSIAGRAPLIGTGLSGVGSVVSAIILGATNDGSAEALVGGDSVAQTPAGPRGGVPVCPVCPEEPLADECLCCPVDGYSTRSCLTNSGVHIALGAVACEGLGPSGGTAQVDGSITINSEDGTCPFTFTTGTYETDQLATIYRDDMGMTQLTVAAALEGTIEPVLNVTVCRVSSMTLSLNGTVTTTLPDATGVTATFEGASVTADKIVFGPDCLPLSYELTFSGTVSFLPLQAANPLVMQFTSFVLDYAATPGASELELTGTVGSTCVGGGASLTTANALTIPLGDACPQSGHVNVSGTGGAMAMVSYQDGQVIIDQGGSQSTIDNCLDAALMTCP